MAMRWRIQFPDLSAQAAGARLSGQAVGNRKIVAETLSSPHLVVSLPWLGSMGLIDDEGAGADRQKSVGLPAGRCSGSYSLSSASPTDFSNVLLPEKIAAGDCW